MARPLCIYHGFCDDGFAAAFIVHKALFGEVDLYPGVYQTPPPDVTGRDVILVDFSYKRPVLNAMAKDARSILILDHHKTAAEDLAGIPTAPATWNQHLDGMLPVNALFDMSRSGAGLAWDFFFSSNSRPLFVNYIEDRDLWRKKMPQGDEFTMALRSYPQTLEAWEPLFSNAHRLADEGKHILRYYRTVVDALKLETIRSRIAFGKHVWSLNIVNAPYAFASEVAGEIADHSVDFGASYFRKADGRWQYSLRSRTDFDVSAVALCFGGGGHKAAAGFTVSEPIHSTI